MAYLWRVKGWRTNSSTFTISWFHTNVTFPRYFALVYVTFPSFYAARILIFLEIFCNSKNISYLCACNKTCLCGRPCPIRQFAKNKSESVTTYWKIELYSLCFRPYVVTRTGWIVALSDMDWQMCHEDLLESFNLASVLLDSLSLITSVIASWRRSVYWEWMTRWWCRRAGRLSDGRCWGQCLNHWTLWWRRGRRCGRELRAWCHNRCPPPLLIWHAGTYLFLPTRWWLFLRHPLPPPEHSSKDW